MLTIQQKKRTSMLDLSTETYFFSGGCQRISHITVVEILEPAWFELFLILLYIEAMNLTNPLEFWICSVSVPCFPVLWAYTFYAPHSIRLSSYTATTYTWRQKNGGGTDWNLCFYDSILSTFVVQSSNIFLFLIRNSISYFMCSKALN